MEQLKQLEQLLELLNEFKTRNLGVPDYPYDILGFSEWLEFEKIPELKGFLKNG